MMQRPPPIDERRFPWAGIVAFSLVLIAIASVLWSAQSLVYRLRNWHILQPGEIVWDTKACTSIDIFFASQDFPFIQRNEEVAGTVFGIQSPNVAIKCAARWH